MTEAARSAGRSGTRPPGAGRHRGRTCWSIWRDDPSVTVRAALALNTAAPPQVNDVLARDRDERVRVLLARKLAALVPDAVAARISARLYQETWETLSALVADEAVRVRAVIAEAIKDLPNAPRELIARLAHDTETAGVRAGDPAVAAADHRGSGGAGDRGRLPPARVLAVARRAGI